MADDLPLHVRVAEALGWTWKLTWNQGARFFCPPTYDRIHDIHPENYKDADGPVPQATDAYRYVPRYDTDWSATGPLIERLEILIAKKPGDESEGWMAMAGVTWDGHPYVSEHAEDHWGETPLQAVCYLILELHKAGKL